MSNPDSANQLDQSTFYLGNTGTAAIQTEALAARVDGLEAKVDGVTTEMRAMGSNFAALTEMLRTALAPGRTNTHYILGIIYELPETSCIYRRPPESRVPAIWIL